MESEYDLMNYLEIDSIIEQLHKKKDRVATEMNLKSFHTRVVFDGLSVHVYAPKIDKLVNEKIEVCLVIDSLIERWNFRKKHFNRYCEGLLPEELKQLLSMKKDYERIDEVMDEIFEIEVATAFYFGYEPEEEKIRVTNDLLENLDLILEVL